MLDRMYGWYNYFTGSDDDVEDKAPEVQDKKEVLEVKDKKEVLEVKEIKHSVASTSESSSLSISKPVDPTELTVLMNLSRITKNLQDQLLEQLSNILDPDAFAAVISDKVKIDDKSDNILFHYKNVIRILGESSELLRVYENLHKHFLTIQKASGRIGQAVTAIYNRHEINKLVDELFKKQTEFDDTLIRLSLHQIEFRLPIAEDFKRLLHFLLPVKNLNAAARANPIYKSSLETEKYSTLVEEVKNENMKLDPKLQTIISQLQGTAKKTCSILFRLAKEKQLVDTAKLSIMRAVANLELLMKKFDDFGKTDKGIFATLKFAYQARSEVMQFIANLPVAISSVRGITRDYLLETLEQFNLVFRDLTLHADKIEIDYRLKEGYISTYAISDHSMSSLAKLYNDWIESMGYQFKEQDRYPYKHALLEQRNILLTGTPHINLLAKQIIAKRIASIEDSFKTLPDEKKPAKEDKADDRLLTRVDIIDIAINDLKEKRHQHFCRTTTLVFEQCIAAFTYLRDYLKEGSGYRLHDALEIMKENKTDYYAVLDQYQKAVLKRILVIDRAIPEEALGKITINFASKRRESQEQKEQKEQHPAVHHVNELKKISGQIALLEKEHNTVAYKIHSFFVGNTKLKKIRLLSELKTQLESKATTTMASSIDTMAQKRGFRCDLHLLFKDRTGLLINQCMASDKTREDVLAEINVAMKSLKYRSDCDEKAFAVSKEGNLFKCLSKIKQNFASNRSVLAGFSHLETEIVYNAGEKWREKIGHWENFRVEMLSASTMRLG